MQQARLVPLSTAPRNALVMEFEQSSNLAAFYERYKNSTNPIERYIAFKTFSDCHVDVGMLNQTKGIPSEERYVEEVLLTSKNPTINRPQKLAYLRKSWQRCANFTFTPEIHKEVNTILTALNKQGELPIAASLFLEKNKANPQAISQLLDNLAMLDNGYMWLETLPVLSGYVLSGQLVMDGKPFDSVVVREILEALTMAACDIGQVCDAGTASSDDIFSLAQPATAIMIHNQELSGSTRLANNGRIFTVTFSDGGTENYTFSSANSLFSVRPRTLVLGSGVASGCS